MKSEAILLNSVKRSDKELQRVTNKGTQNTKELQQADRQSLLPDGVYTLEDLRDYGREQKYCPYYLARYLVSRKQQAFTRQGINPPVTKSLTVILALPFFLRYPLLTL